MDGPYEQGVASGVHEEDQAVVPGAGGGLLGVEPQIGGPAVVAVGDEGLPLGEVLVDGGQVVRVGEGPQPVGEAVLGGGGEQRFGADRALDDGRGAVGGTVPAVGEEERFEVGVGVAHERGAVLDDVRHHVLVGEDDACFARGQAQGPDEAALEGVAVVLLVHVERGFGVGGEDALFLPAAQGLAGLAVAVGGGGGLREDQTDDVVRIGRLQVAQAVRPDDHVIRGRGHGGQAADPLRHIAQPSEGGQLETLSGVPWSAHWEMLCRIPG